MTCECLLSRTTWKVSFETSLIIMRSRRWFCLREGSSRYTEKTKLQTSNVGRLWARPGLCVPPGTMPCGRWEHPPYPGAESHTRCLTRVPRPGQCAVSTPPDNEENPETGYWVLFSILLRTLMKRADVRFLRGVSHENHSWSKEKKNHSSILCVTQNRRHCFQAGPWGLWES